MPAGARRWRPCSTRRPGELLLTWAPMPELPAGGGWAAGLRPLGAAAAGRRAARGGCADGRGVLTSAPVSSRAHCSVLKTAVASGALTGPEAPQLPASRYEKKFPLLEIALEGLRCVLSLLTAVIGRRLLMLGVA